LEIIGEQLELLHRPLWQFVLDVVHGFVEVFAGDAVGRVEVLNLLLFAEGGLVRPYLLVDAVEHGVLRLLVEWRHLELRLL